MIAVCVSVFAWVAFKCVEEQVWHHLHQRCIKRTKLLHEMPHLGGSFHSFPWKMEFDCMSWVSNTILKRRNPNGSSDFSSSKKKTQNKFGTLFNADKFRIRCMSHFYDWEKQREENWNHKYLNCMKSNAFRFHSALFCFPMIRWGSMRWTWG